MATLPPEIWHQIIYYLTNTEKIICQLSSSVLHVLAEDEMYKIIINDNHILEHFHIYSYILDSYPKTAIRLLGFFLMENKKKEEQLRSIINTNAKKVRNKHRRDEMFVSYHYQLSNQYEDVNQALE